MRQFGQLLLNLLFIAKTCLRFFLDQNQIRCGLIPFFQLRRKPITAPRNGLDIAALSQGLTKHIDVLREVALLYKTVGPELLHQIVLLHYLAIVLHQQQQSVDGFGLERHGFPIVQQQTVHGVDAESAELVKMLDLFAHTAIEKRLRNK